MLKVEHMLLAFGDTLHDIRLLRFSSWLCLLMSILVLSCYIYFIYVASYASPEKGFFHRFKFLIIYRELLLRIVTLFSGFLLILSLLLFFELGTRQQSIRDNSQIIFQKIFSEYEGLSEEEIEYVKTNKKIQWYYERLRKDLFEREIQ